MTSERQLTRKKRRLSIWHQKLISTAIALDRLGPDYRLTTRLWRQPDGTLQITGEGDPDLDLAQLKRFAKLALGSGGSSGPASGPVAIQLVEEPQHAQGVGAAVHQVADRVLGVPGRVEGEGLQEALELLPAPLDVPDEDTTLGHVLIIGDGGLDARCPSRENP